MKSTFIIFLLFSGCSVPGQQTSNNIFSDTSLYFIHQMDSLRPVHLSQNELSEIEVYLIKAVNELYQSQKRYADSVNPKKKKNRYQDCRINLDDYFFQLIPAINKNGQKEVWINGNCKAWFKKETSKKTIADLEWKKKFVNGQMIEDGGSCFIYLHINLTLKTHGWLAMNGEA